MHVQQVHFKGFCVILGARVAVSHY